MATKKPAQAVATAAVPAAINLVLLQAIATASAGTPGYMQAPIADLQPLKDAGYVDINPDPQFALNGDVNVPGVRISAAGTEYLAKSAAPAAPVAGAWAPAAAAAAPAAAPAAVAEPKREFAIVAFTLPEAKRVGGVGGARPETFPFSKLEPGQAFFIGATDKVPNPVKKYASTVASATARYATEDATKMVANRKGRMVAEKTIVRQFAIRNVDDGAAFGFPGVKGAAIGRVK